MILPRPNGDLRPFPGPTDEVGHLTEFRPFPLLGNPHVQTILGNLLAGSPFTSPTRERHVLLTDGDRVVLHDSIATGWRAGNRISLLLHGLGGSHRSYHVQRLAWLLLRAGVRVVRMDLRGCGHGMRVARRFYHAGSSGDVRAALAELRRWSPTSPLGLLGISLGGNIALKLAGEAAAETVPGLEYVVALSPPIDLERCSVLLGLPRNRFYERHFVRQLVNQVRRRQRLFPDLPRVRFPKRLTMRGFDDLYTAPRWGFADALDYYRRSSSRPLLGQIPVPTLVLAARDDPFVDGGAFEDLTLPSHVALRVLERGGHLGFLGRDGAGGIRWAERRIIEWIRQPR